jgi:prephenate dehydrogenase
MADPAFGHVVIVGIGLIGGSLARALKAQGAAERITGVARSQQTLDRALELGIVDAAMRDVSAAVRDADIVVLATPVASINALLAGISASLPEQCVVTDAGSVKGSIVDAARQALGEGVSRFVPGHPIAGTEESGVDASFATLFQHRRVILTPLRENRPGDVALIRTMWESCGAVVSEMPVDEHDAILAATSHLPHLLAFALVDFLSARDNQREIFANSAGGFRDFTRIAASNPVMWRDICLANREQLIPLLSEIQAQLSSYRSLLETGDGLALEQAFERAKRARDELPGIVAASLGLPLEEDTGGVEE